MGFNERVLEDPNGWDERMEMLEKHFKGRIIALRLLRTWGDEEGWASEGPGL
jgi:hypothetical protein